MLGMGLCEGVRRGSLCGGKLAGEGAVGRESFVGEWRSDSVAASVLSEATEGVVLPLMVEEAICLEDAAPFVR